MTEDQDIEKTLKRLNIPIRARILGEASQIDEFEVKRFFKEKFKEKRRDFHKYHKRR